ncbi:MAG: hypothetical protein KHX35_05850 [Sutterella wadsworthensis]|nr:hypothetical protein [Sutterella wadsworthensis]
MIKTGPTYKRLLLLALIAFLKTPSQTLIRKVWIEVSETTKEGIGYKRAIQALRDQLNVKIILNDSPSCGIKGGLLFVQNWGVIDPLSLYLTFRDELFAIGFTEDHIKSIQSIEKIVVSLRS